jgi:hypothetical protein
MAIGTCAENFYGDVLKTLEAILPSVARVPTHGYRYRLAFGMKYA